MREPVRGSILFLDDDPPILNGLRVRLHRFDRRWEMRFTDCGEDALAELERWEADVVVSDVRMPGMDGVEFLRTVSERWPHTIRIALSGFAGEEQAVKLVPHAHQYLNKPCESPQLENLLERCLALPALLPDKRLRALAGAIRTLPVTVAAHTELQAALSRESPKVHVVADIIARDTGLSAKVLQLANSAFFRLARRITSVEKAVGHLGLAVMRSLMSSTAVFWRGAEHENAALRLDELQRHACLTGAAARALANNTPQADDAWAAGLLHDVGYWMLARECQPDLLRCLELAETEGLPLHEAETRLIGASHAQLGAYLLGLWGLPQEVVEAVAYHHAPEAARQTQFGALGALTIAQSLCQAGDAEIFHGRTVPETLVDAGYLRSINAPFDWAEATRRVEASRRPAETVS